MIKIIKGVFGLRDNKIIRPIRAGDSPIELDSAAEERLVKLGVAEYVNVPLKEEPAAEEPAAPVPKASVKTGKKAKTQQTKEPAEPAAEEPAGDITDEAEAPDLSAADMVVDE